MVCYGIFLDQMSLTSILIPILCTLHWFFKFRYFYQRCGRRSTSIHPYSFIWDMFHVIIHLLSKNGEVNFGDFFLNREKLIFSQKIPVFLIPVHDIGSKDRNSDAPSKITYRLWKSPWKSLSKILAFFSGPVPVENRKKDKINEESLVKIGTKLTFLGWTFDI